MKTEFDVKIPRNQYGKGKYATIFWDFYDSEHMTVKYTFDNKEDAKKLYKSCNNIISRNGMIDIRSCIIENEVYLEKYNIDEN